MANNPISMSEIRQILRLHSQGCSKLKIAEQTGLSRNTLKKYLKTFTSAGLTFDEINELSDKELEDLFVKPEDKPVHERLQILFSLFPVIEKELKRKGVTRQMLWEEYRQSHPDGLGHTAGAGLVGLTKRVGHTCAPKLARVCDQGAGARLR